MDGMNEKVEKYDHSQAIRQQIKHVNHLISSADTEDEQSFSQYFSKAFMGIASLQAMLDPFKDEDEEWSQSLKDYDPLPKTRGENLGFIVKALTEIMNFLHEKNLFYAYKAGRRET